MKLEFKPKARMLLQLGDQLIRSESIALLELVKNAYDANASFVTVTMKNLETARDGVIIIEDDGDGMDAEIIQNVWMQPGSDYKDKLIKSGKIDESQRVPIGGKGIGRFGVHKLGETIELVSKKKGFSEIVLSFDWRDFLEDKLLKDIKIDFNENHEPQHFRDGRTGTKITIKDLKNKWTRGTVRDLYRSINSLNPPFGAADPFKTYFKLDNQSWLKNLTKFDDVKSHALYDAEAVIVGSKIKELTYKFTPWDTMEKLNPREVTRNDIKLVEDVIDEKTRKKKQVTIDLSTHKIGPIKFRLLIFDRSSKILSLGLADKKGFKEYLDANGGVRVFRNDIRVYDYGEPDNDWLRLDMMRVNQPGKTISNNLIIGAVNLSLNESVDLEEKTNREGFVENNAYRKFVAAIRFTIDKILTERNSDKIKVRKFYGASSVTEPVVGRLKSMQSMITEKVKEPELKKDLLKAVSNIERDYKQINEIYTRSSSAGLSLSIVIHEIIHMISELAAAIEKEPTDSHVKRLVKTLQKTVGDYAGVIKQSKKSRVNLIKVTRQALSNIQFRIKAHEVHLINKFENRGELDTFVSCSQNLILSTIINVVDNSIWWQIYSDVKDKKLFIDIVEYPENYISILIADNGPGFSIPTEEAVKPFISDKPGGMGLGLHLADEVMSGQRGKLIFPDPYDFEMPEEFQNGAKLLLSFRRG